MNHLVKTAVVPSLPAQHPHPVRRASPPSGLCDGGAASGSSTNGETSDYQRSTPSPRDDDEDDEEDDDIIYSDVEDHDSEDPDEPPAKPCIPKVNTQAKPATLLPKASITAPPMNGIHNKHIPTLTPKPINFLVNVPMAPSPAASANIMAPTLGGVLKKAPLPMRSVPPTPPPSIQNVVPFSPKSFYAKAAPAPPSGLILQQQIRPPTQAASKPIIIVSTQPQPLASAVPSSLSFVTAQPPQITTAQPTTVFAANCRPSLIPMVPVATAAPSPAVVTPVVTPTVTPAMTPVGSPLKMTTVTAPPPPPSPQLPPTVIRSPIKLPTVPLPRATPVQLPTATTRQIQLPTQPLPQQKQQQPSLGKVATVSTQQLLPQKPVPNCAPPKQAMMAQTKSEAVQLPQQPHPQVSRRKSEDQLRDKLLQDMTIKQQLSRFHTIGKADKRKSKSPTKKASKDKSSPSLKHHAIKSKDKPTQPQMLQTAKPPKPAVEQPSISTKTPELKTNPPQDQPKHNTLVEVTHLSRSPMDQSNSSEIEKAQSKSTVEEIGDCNPEEAKLPNSKPTTQHVSSKEQIRPDSSEKQIKPSSSKEQINSSSTQEQIKTNSCKEQIRPDSSRELIEPSSSKEQIRPNNSTEQIKKPISSKEQIKYSSRPKRETSSVSKNMVKAPHSLIKLKKLEVKLKKLPLLLVGSTVNVNTARIPPKSFSCNNKRRHSDSLLAIANSKSSKTAKSSLSDQPTNNKKTATTPQQALIRPAILKHTSSTNKPESKTSSSSHPRLSLSGSASDISLAKKNDPFTLPTGSPQKTAFLFGNAGGDCFETVDKHNSDLSDEEDGSAMEIDEDSMQSLASSAASDLKETKKTETNNLTTAMETPPATVSGLNSSAKSKTAPLSPKWHNLANAVNSEHSALPILIKREEEKSAPQENKQFRFPTIQTTSNNFIECKWDECSASFTTYGRLSDHLKAVHVIGQVKECEARIKANEETFYKCLWSDCKVYNMASSSRSWLEKHVPVHGGKYPFGCIVSGCKKRFSTQKMLSRHVNQHFSENEDKQVNGSGSIGGGVGSIAGISTGSGSGSGIAGSTKSHVAKKSTNKSWQDSAASGSHCPYRGLIGVEKKPKSGSGMSGTGNGGENGKTSSDTLYLARKTACHTKEITKKFSSSTKNLKRAGIRLKFRQGGVFSARNFDYFDPSVIPGLRHAVYDLNVKSTLTAIDADQNVNFVGRVVALRGSEKSSSSQKSALVRWSPENLIPDEWIELPPTSEQPSFQLSKQVKVCNLNADSKCRLERHLYGSPPTDSSTADDRHQRKPKSSRKRPQVHVPSMWAPPPPKGLF